MTTLAVVIDRTTGSMVTSFLVWAKFRAYPQCEGDGVYVGDVTIGPNETSVIYSWTTPNGSADWKFIAAPKYNEIVGVYGQMDAV